MTQKPEKPIMDNPEPWPEDCYLEWGCCIGCDESRKEYIRGLQRGVWYKGKHYSCFCHDCKCDVCSWLYDGGCQRKAFDDYGLAT